MPPTADMESASVGPHDNMRPCGTARGHNFLRKFAFAGDGRMGSCAPTEYVR